MNEDTLKARLPQPVASRLQSLRAKDGAVTFVLNASGLDAVGREELESAAKEALLGGDVAEVRVALTADKPARRIIAIASGKGGVGKSTLTANLAVALKRLDRKVGVVDADIYGPSQPRLLASEGTKPRATEKMLIPVPSAEGIPVLSMGHLVEAGKAIAWRGPMVTSALGQLIDADWGETELLLVDMPPGTGDIQLTMVQRHRPAGVVIVSTPQDLALIDATRAAQLFQHAQIPIIGVVENMAGYVCPHCGEASDPFGQGGAEKTARDMGLAFLGRVPLAMAIREASDAGTPPAASDCAEGEAFHQIAQRIARWLDGSAA
jgi:ATP-binding protein involved in chromosome partitioning